MPSLSDHDLTNLRALLVSWNFKPSHATTILRAYYERGGEPDLGSTRIGNELSKRLEAELPAMRSRVLKRHVAADGTTKLLIGFDRGGAVEAVLMPAYRPDRAAACVSSQIGCAMRCDFCASTKNGLERNLDAGEIVEQFLHLRREATQLGRRIASLAFMGMGEPMHNLGQVIAAIERISHPALGSLGRRHITVSTVGIVEGIDRLAESGLNVHLALSLHAADDATRAKIVPMTRRHQVRDIVDAARRYQARTRRVVTIEWCLLAGVNDSDDQAEKLAALLQGFRAHVNLIPFNPIGPGLSGTVYIRPGQERVERFMSILSSPTPATRAAMTSPRRVGNCVRCR
jgi:23S rRNA (adenine2503-C2)-methyltransferase